MTSYHSLRRLLHPETIAVIGGELAAEVIRQCEKIGYAGEIWPVNPQREHLAGRACFPDVEALPRAPDAAFLAVSREKTVQMIRTLSAMGAGGAVCYASGFAEVGPEGAALQAELVAGMGEMAVVGPNCYGMLNYLDGVALWPDQHGGDRVERGVAIIMQSGNIGLSLTMQQRSLPIAYLISVGNQAGIKQHEYIEALIEDPRVTAIGMHIEGLQDVAAFSRAALQALRRRVPLVALKTGVSERGRELALSHTSSLSGSNRLFDTLAERFGIARVDTLPQFLETLKFLSVVGPLPGGSIASISCSGGEAAILADTAGRLNVPLAPMVEPQRGALRQILGDRVALSNPLDYHTYIWGDQQAQAACFAGMMLGPQDVTLKILDFPRAGQCDDTAWRQTAQAFCQAVAESGRSAAMVSTLPENLPDEIRASLLEQGIAPMQGLEECLIAVRSAARIFEKQQNAAELLELETAQPRNGKPISLNEADSKALLAQFGIPFPQFEICSRDTAREAGSRLGYPLALKILSDTILHKSDVGGVYLNLEHEAELLSALEAMQDLGDSFLIEQMAPRPVVELLLGLSHDMQFGPALVIAAGGTLVEMLRDSKTLLFPVQESEVRHALASLKIGAFLNGFRGGPKADIESLVRTVMSLAKFAELHAGEIDEVDINPLFVLPEGQGVIAVDALVRLVR